jgi:hypothetical protein
MARCAPAECLTFITVSVLVSPEHVGFEVQTDTVHGSNNAAACCWGPWAVQAAVPVLLHPRLQLCFKHILLDLCISTAAVRTTNERTWLCMRCCFDCWFGYLCEVQGMFILATVCADAPPRREPGSVVTHLPGLLQGGPHGPCQACFSCSCC